MTDYTAQIKSKGLDATGVTEDIARKLYNGLGSHMMFIVEGRVDARTEGNDGTHKVQLSLTQVEPAVDDTLAEHLRELSRTVYVNRAQADGQLAIDQSIEGEERTVADVMAAGAQHRPHPFLPDDAGKDSPICDVCGALETAPLHSTQDTLDTTTDSGNTNEPADDENHDEAAEGNNEPTGDEDPDWVAGATSSPLPDPFTAA